MSFKFLLILKPIIGTSGNTFLRPSSLLFKGGKDFYYLETAFKTIFVRSI